MKGNDSTQHMCICDTEFALHWCFIVLSNMIMVPLFPLRTCILFYWYLYRLTTHTILNDTDQYTFHIITKLGHREKNHSSNQKGLLKREYCRHHQQICRSQSSFNIPSSRETQSIQVDMWVLLSSPMRLLSYYLSYDLLDVQLSPRTLKQRQS